MPDSARAKLIEGAFELLRTQVHTGEQNPVGLFELPTAQRVVVAQLADARPADSGFELDIRSMQNQMQYSGGRVHALLMDWFEPESLHARTTYVPSRRR